MRFALAASACFALWMSVTNIVNYFQITNRDTKNKVYVCLPPCYLEWFNYKFPNPEFAIDKSRLVVQLFNGCQVSKDVVRLWNQHFDRVLGKLGLHLSMRDLEAHATKVDGELGILNSSTDDVLVYTKSPKSYFPLT